MHPLQEDYELGPDEELSWGYDNAEGQAGGALRLLARICRYAPLQLLQPAPGVGLCLEVVMQMMHVPYFLQVSSGCCIPCMLACDSQLLLRSMWVPWHGTWNNSICLT